MHDFPIPRHILHHHPVESYVASFCKLGSSLVISLTHCRVLISQVLITILLLILPRHLSLSNHIFLPSRLVPLVSLYLLEFIDNSNYFVGAASARSSSVYDLHGVSWSYSSLLWQSPTKLFEVRSSTKNKITWCKLCYLPLRYLTSDSEWWMLDVKTDCLAELY
jgi:hypothetical protein